jgi:hypothetical protein
MITAKYPVLSSSFRLSAYKESALFLLLAWSLTLSFFFGQDGEIERGSMFYFLVILPFLLVPLLHIRSVIFHLAQKVLFISAFSLVSGLWSLINGEASAAFQLFFWAYVLAYISRSDAVISLNSFAKLFIFLIAFGLLVDIFLDINHYGFLASKNYYANESHRLSLYPNIANSGFFAFIFLALFSLNLNVARKYWWILVASLLIALISHVRSIQIAILLYLAFRFFLEINKNMSPRRMLFFSVIFAVLPLFLTNAYGVLYQLSTYSDFLLDFLFRGDSTLSGEGLDNQIFRPLVWAEHWNIFAESDFLMGVGPKQLSELVDLRLTYGDSVGFLSRLLALYGLPAILFFLQILYWLTSRASQRDTWACAMFPPTFFLMMTWGSAFHPSNGFAMLLLLILIRGRACVDSGREGVENR